MSEIPRPQLTVIAGPNGAGKSTITEAGITPFLAHFNVPLVNPDNIARQIAPDNINSPETHLRAGRIALRQRENLLKEHKSFAMETTLSGQGEIDMIRRAHAAGYKINLIFVGIGSSQHSHARVAERVAKGGHAVAASDIERRYVRTMANLPRILPFATRVRIIDNSAKERRRIFNKDQDRIKYISKDMPAWAREALASILP